MVLLVATHVLLVYSYVRTKPLKGALPRARVAPTNNELPVYESATATPNSFPAESPFSVSPTANQLVPLQPNTCARPLSFPGTSALAPTANRLPSPEMWMASPQASAKCGDTSDEPACAQAVPLKSNTRAIPNPPSIKS